MPARRQPNGSIPNLARVGSTFFGGILCAGIGDAGVAAREVFPCYSWFLFALVPGQESQYAVRLQEVHGQKLTAARAVSGRGHFVDQAAKRDGPRNSFSSSAPAVEKGRTDEQVRLRRVMEKDYLPAPCRYELVVMT